MTERASELQTLGLRVIAISAEAPSESQIMKERHSAPFLFVTDHDLTLIDRYNMRNNEIAKPGFVLLHHQQEIWRKTEFKYLRTAPDVILRLIKSTLEEHLQSEAKKSNHGQE